MLKRKYGSRYDWKRVKTAYTELFIESETFKGYVSLLYMKEVRKPLFMSYESRTVCIADNGYYWMQHFPEGQFYSITTVLDSSGNIVQWYIDICKENGYCTKNGPWMDDLYLDLIILPTGEIIEKDRDELEVALKNEKISTSEYELAWKEFNRLTVDLAEGGLKLRELTMPHYDLLEQKLNDKEGSG
ncbi:DUF402 domain-containing protein [Sporosarcina sp. NPDC096371]|uniref:DUF402 domain-containing protein n=1 Tax=Sporosarcina sp. NPDC096371 TaxID=3364530 RepID=UPI0037F48B47